MTTNKPGKHWTLVSILLVIVITVSSTVAWIRYSQNQPIEISIPQAQELQGRIYLNGAVNNPGSYPLRAGDTIEALIQAVGGTTASADLNQLKLYIPEAEEAYQPQKIDLNRAEAWLLEALPEIGEIKAQSIVDYRRQNGSFHNTAELIKVEGIGITTYQKIKNLITVTN